MLSPFYTSDDTTVLMINAKSFVLHSDLIKFQKKVCPKAERNNGVMIISSDLLSQCRGTVLRIIQ